MAALYNVGAITPQLFLLTTVISISFKGRDMFKKFKDFAMRGNVVDMAGSTIPIKASKCCHCKSQV